MIEYTSEEKDFIEKLAKGTGGKRLIRLLKKIEFSYADIRNLNGTSAETRVDALKILREALLDKLVVLSGQQEPADNDEYH